MALGFQDNIGNILGANTADNLYNSDTVAADADGSIIERLEYIQGVTSGITAGQVILQGAQETATSTTSIKITGLAGYGDDFFNNQFYIQVLHNNNSAGNAPEKQTRKITDYVSSTGTFTCDAFGAAVETDDLCLILHESAVAIGSDNNDNVFASTNIAANADGTVLERLEDIKDRLDTVDNYVDTEIAAIQAVTDTLPDAGALTTIAAAIDTIDNFVDGANLEKLTGAADGGTHLYPDNVAQDSVVAYMMSKADPAVVTSYDNSTDSLEAIADAVSAVASAVDAVDNFVDTEVGAIKTETDQIGTIVNTAGTATLGALLGDFANSSLVTRVGNVQTEVDKIGTISNAGGTATIGGVIGPVANTTIVARLANIQTEADKVGTISNAGGTATIGGVIGPVANNTIVARLETITTETDQIGTMVNAGGTATVGGVFGDMANVTLATRLGLADGTTTESIQGKLGTDTELADRSLYDILNGGGPAAAATAAAPANDVSLYGALRAVYNLVVPAAATGETVIDEGDYDWTTAYPAILTIAPAAGAALSDVVVHFDMDKLTTGFATVYAAQTLSVYVERKLDGTNWRRELIAKAAFDGDSADTRDLVVEVGSVGIAQQARIVAALSAEVNGTAETDIPYVVYYKGLAAPTITPLTATP